MTEKQKLKKEKALIENLLKLIDKNWTKDKCKGYAPGCPNCQGQILVGCLEDYRDLIDFELNG